MESEVYIVGYECSCCAVVASEAEASLLRLPKLTSDRGQKVLVAFLVAHLVVVALSGFRGFQQTLRDAERSTTAPIEYPPVLSWYASSTASSQGFGFFAPSVSSECRVIVSGCARSKGNWRDIDFGVRHEGQQLLSSFLGAGMQDDGPQGKAIQDVLSRSLAAGVFSQHPKIDAVIVKYQAELIGPLRSPDRNYREWINVRIFTYYRPNA